MTIAKSSPSIRICPRLSKGYGKKLSWLKAIVHKIDDNCAKIDDVKLQVVKSWYEKHFGDLS
jgi:hypothetical protein